MTGLFIIGALASIAGVIILVAHRLKNQPSSIQSNSVTRHEFKLTKEQAVDFCEKLQGAVEKKENMMQFFVDEDNLIKVTIVE